jgi:GNAT superfamily N-acetyltransferase
MNPPSPAAGPAWTLTAVSYASSAGRRLVSAFHQEQLATYGFADDPASTPAGDFMPPHGAFLIASAGGPALACGGWRTASPATAEIKRMYVAPAARGQGLGRIVFQALEDDAARHGKTRVILETGAHSHSALALFISCGFTFTDSYVEGRDPQINRAMQKIITPEKRKLQQNMHDRGQ